MLDFWYFGMRFGIQNADLSEGGEAALYYVLALGSSFLWSAAAVANPVGALLLKTMSLTASLSPRALDARFQSAAKKDIATFRELAVTDLSNNYRAIASNMGDLTTKLQALLTQLGIEDAQSSEQIEAMKEVAWGFIFHSSIGYNKPADLEQLAKKNAEAVWAKFLPCYRWYTKMENRAVTCYYSALVESGIADQSPMVTRGFVPGEGMIYRFPKGATVFKRLLPGNYVRIEVTP